MYRYVANCSARRRDCFFPDVCAMISVRGGEGISCTGLYGEALAERDLKGIMPLLPFLFARSARSIGKIFIASGLTSLTTEGK